MTRALRRNTWLALLLGMVLAGTVVRSMAEGPRFGPGEKDKLKAARTIAPENGADERTEIPLGIRVAGNGVVEPAGREIKVAPQVPGRIAKMWVKEGDVVLPGAALADFENAVERAALDAAEGDLKAAQAELVRTLRGLRKEDIDAVVADTEAIRARAEQSHDLLERLRTLAETRAATPDELDRSEKQAEADRRSLESAEAKRRAALAGGRAEDIQVAQARLAGARARRDQAKAALERLTVRAPAHGEILQVKLQPGEYASPGAGEPLVIMGDTGRLRVRMDVDERNIAKIKMGAPAFVTLSAFPDRHIPGRVVEIGRRMGRKNVRTDDPTERIDTKILEVVLELDDKAGLVPGLRVVSYLEAS